MVLIFLDTINPRIEYATSIIFEIVLNIPYRITINEDEYTSCQTAKFAYSKKSHIQGLRIYPSELMNQDSWKKFVPEVKVHSNQRSYLFPTYQDDLLGFDLFAFVFYLLSRYEEYQTDSIDKHKRFEYENSTVYKLNSINEPILNFWISYFFEKLKEIFSELQASTPSFNFVSSIDIDNAFAYAHKGFNRNLAGFIKDGFSFKINKVKKRLISLIDESKDPYFTYSKIAGLTQVSETNLKYFVLIGDYSDFDKNPNFQNKGFRNLIKTLAKDFEIGVHPSYQSYDEPHKISKEVKRLEDIIERKIDSARCHFLRVKFPDTYQAFLHVGIKHDYSMLFPSKCGFKCGLAQPYPWFDLSKNKATELLIHPSSVMEGTLRDYEKLNIDEALERIRNLINQTKLYGGEFISVWHNDSFSEENKDWIKVYTKMLQLF
jgi:hypothetical protein